MTLFARLFIFIALIISPLQGIAGDYQPVGPILVSRPVGGGIFVFYDMGSGETWETPIEDESLLSWSPDGCYLMTGTNAGNYRLFNFANRSFEAHIIGQTDITVDRHLQYSIPYFSPDGQQIAYSIHRYADSNSPDLSQIEIINIETMEIENTYEINAGGGITGWRSNSELNYGLWDSDNNRLSYILDLTTGESRLNEEVALPVPPAPDEWWYSLLYHDVPSPNGMIHAVFYDKWSVGYWANSTEDDNPNALDEDQIAELLDVPEDSGFDLYFVQTGEWRSVAFFDKFVEQIVWSPDSTRLAVSNIRLRPRIADDRIYIYDVNSDSFQQLGDYSPAYDTEYGLFHFAWSPDGEWLAFADASEGWFAYRIDDDFVVPLSDYFTGYMTTLYWSPNMDYTASPCNAD